MNGFLVVDCDYMVKRDGYPDGLNFVSFVFIFFVCLYIINLDIIYKINVYKNKDISGENNFNFLL